MQYLQTSFRTSESWAEGHFTGVVVAAMFSVAAIISGCDRVGEDPVITLDGAAPVDASPEPDAHSAGDARSDGRRGDACGNGVVDEGEACDDGNDVTGDGCESDCALTCTADVDCETGDLCNPSRCGSDNTCLAPTVAPDGTTCDADMDAGTYDLCRGGVCALSVCGDGVVDSDSGEDCDDANDVADDGCESDCTFSCVEHEECDTGSPCSSSFCGVSNACTIPAPVSGDLCDSDGDPDTRDVCVAGTCQFSVCGDGVADTGGGEICDDGDDISGNGCESDCTWSCTSHADCDDGDPCNGEERCNLTTHACGGSGVFGLC
jgi:cysteine-rich repeat protein